MNIGERTSTNLGHDCRRVDALIVVPSVQTALCWHGWPVHISRQQATVGKTLHVCEFVSGAGAALRRAAAAAASLLQRDAAVLPRGCQVGLRGDEAVVLRRSGQKNHWQGDVTDGDGPQAQEVKNLLLEAAPFSEEGGGRIVVRHVAPRLDSPSGRRARRVVGMSKALALSHPPGIIPLLKGQSDKKCVCLLSSFLSYFAIFFSLHQIKTVHFNGH